MVPVIIIIIKIGMYILIHNYAKKRFIIIIRYNISSSFRKKSTIFKLKRIHRPTKTYLSNHMKYLIS